MEKYFDILNTRLVFIGNKASETFWNSHWEKQDIRQLVKSAVFNRLILGPTRKYLPQGGKILEGGCGLCQNVYSLHKNGYDTYGVDYAMETVRRVNEAMPELKVFRGDVRHLDFDDDYFEGYWSLGVIEHFYLGYDDILKEMSRVTKAGGYVFLTFPCMSRFRQTKAGQSKYRPWSADHALIENFYQFALPVKEVVAKFLNMRFSLVQSLPLGGLKGFKDEIEYAPLNKVLQTLYDSTSFPFKALAWGLDRVLAPYAGHSRLLVFKNMKSNSSNG